MAEPTTSLATGTAAAVACIANVSINKQINKSDDHNKHYIPLYNDYNCKNDGIKESNIGGSGSGTGDGDIDKDLTVKQKTDDDANNGNELNMRNSGWENNNDDVVLRNPTGKGQSEEVTLYNFFFIWLLMFVRSFIPNRLQLRM